jgi:hypothetical protein
MSERNYPPANLRYLKARFSRFLHPRFWGTGIFLVVLALVIRQYGLNPNIFNAEQNKAKVVKEKAKETSLSAEDRAITADIDNIPTLLSDFDQENLSTNTATTEENENSDVKNIQPPIEDTTKKPDLNANLLVLPSNSSLSPVNQNSAVLNNPFLTQSENLLQPVKVNNNNQFTGVNNLPESPDLTEQTGVSNLDFKLKNQAQNNQNNILINPLSTAIQQSTNTNYINSLGSNTKLKSISLNNNLPNLSLPSTFSRDYTQTRPANQSQNPYTNFNAIPAAPNIEKSNTALSPALNNPYSVNSSSQGSFNSRTATGYNNYGNYNLQQPIQQLPQSNLQQPIQQLPQSNLSYPGQIRQYPR